MRYHKRALRVIALALLLSLLTCNIIAYGDWRDTEFPTDDESSTDDSGSSEQENAPDELIDDRFAEADMRLVSSSGHFALYYDEDGADIYIEDKINNTFWSNKVERVYYDNDEANKNILSMLLTAGVANEDGGLEIYQLYNQKSNADEFLLTPDYSSEKLTININMKNQQIQFSVVLALTEDGFTVTVPGESIVSGGKSKLANLTLMPSFGAALSDQKGYIFYPDGCGGLIDFNGVNEQDPRAYVYPVYGLNQQSVDRKLKNEKTNIKNMTLPVFGIKTPDKGFLAAVTEGEAESNINICPGGYQAPGLSRAYFSFTYMYYSDLEINGSSIQRLMPYSYNTTKTVRYFLLNKEACEYSDMASAYRRYLENAGMFSDSPQTNIKLSLDFFAGINEPGILGNKLVPMTTFSQAGAIVRDLYDKGIKEVDVGLSGWGKGGYDVLPSAVSVESGLGGASGLKSFASFLNSRNIDLYLNANFVDMDPKTGKANARKDVLRDYLGLAATDTRQSKMLMNVQKTLSGLLTQLMKTGLISGRTYAGLEKAGTVVIPNFEKKMDVSRQQTVDAYQSGMKQILSSSEKLRVSGGNQYVLKHATTLSDIPDTTSGYFITTSEVPFYQMVVSGHVQYTSAAGNQSGDYAKQKLRWLEYGSTPRFILTHENPLKMANSGYNALFSSEAHLWKDKILSIYKEYSGQLAGISGKQLLRHTRLSPDLVKVEYDGGHTVYINYGKNAETVDGVEIKGLSYLLK